MSYGRASQRGGILRGLLILLALAALAALGVWLIYTRGSKMQDGLHRTGDRIRGKVISEAEPEPAAPAAAAAEGGGPAAPAGPTAAGPAPRLPKPKSPYTVEKPPPVAKTTHRVAKGETFFSIAETYYENGTLWPIIAEANGLKSPADLREGMTLVIPGK
jgi:nucleoid-associated protein YgaU